MSAWRGSSAVKSVAMQARLESILNTGKSIWSGRSPITPTIDGRDRDTQREGAACPVSSLSLTERPASLNTVKWESEKIPGISLSPPCVHACMHACARAHTHPHTHTHPPACYKCTLMEKKKLTLETFPQNNKWLKTILKKIISFFNLK